MLDMIISLLRQSGADAWEIQDTATEGWEFYLIRHRLDQNRARLVRHTQVKVYKCSEDGTLLGSASGEIPQTVSAEEAKKIITELMQAAVLVRNPFYTLNPPPASPSAIKAPEIGPAQIARKILNVLSSLPETAQADLNSSEVFVNVETHRLITSTGIDVITVHPSSMVEVVVNARQNDHEIELYRLYHFGECNHAMLTEDLTRALQFGPDRLIAKPTPALRQSDVVFSTADACEIYDYFISRMNASMIKRGYSDWKLDTPVVPEPEKDRVTLWARAELPYSSKGGPLDPEGAIAQDMPLIQDGIARHYFGSRQFREYLGMPDGYLAENFEVSGGQASDEEIRSGSFLEIVEFSDFQVNPLSGDIAGEIRLAYWHHDGRVEPVSGGSVSGNMKTLARTLSMSRRQTTYDSLKIPALTRLCGVTITGAVS